MKKWAVWKTIVVTIASVILIAGATVGGIFLAKGTGGEVVMPEDITFVLDEKLYNPDTAQFEVTDNFKMTITTPTANVTETQVRLSFEGTTPPPAADGTITDGIITVPEYVYINEPFNVILNRSVLFNEDGSAMTLADGTIVTSPNGGISTLRARSANIQKLPKSLKVAVDVPVQRIDVEICDIQGNTITSVTEGDTFYAKANFFPEASRYLYSDDKNSDISIKREKATYFEPVGSTEVTFHYDEVTGGYFVAGNARENNQILGYTFKSANTQLEIIDQYAQNTSGEELYNTVLSYLSSSSESVSNRDNLASVDIVVATITSFEVEKTGKPLNDMYSYAGYTLAVRSDVYSNDYIGAKVNGTVGEIQSMLKNVAIMFEYQVQEPFRPITSDILSVRGGKEVVIDGNTYYLPDPNVTNPKWELYTTGVYNFRLNVVLLENDAESESGYKLYTEDNVVIKSTINLSSKMHQEGDVTWAEGVGNSISMTLDFDGEDIIPATKALEGFGQIPSGNIFGTGIYFAYFANPTDVDDVLDANSYDINRSGEYIIGTQSYYLYALKGSELAVKGTGSFELFFASVQTNEFGQFNYDTNGQYIIVQPTLESIKVNVTKTLYAGSVTSLDVTTDNKTGFIYEGSNETITLAFTIKTDSWTVFKEMLASDSNSISLSILNLAGDSINNYFSYEYEIVEETKQVIYTLKVNSGLNLTSDVQLGDVVLEDSYSGNSWSFTTDIGVKIYTPVVKAIEFTSDSVDLNRDITVNQQITADSTFKTIITHYLPDGTSTTIDSDNAIDIFINKLSVRVIDQNGNTNIFSTRWSFATNNSEVITVNNRTFFFKTAENATASIYVQCEGATSNAINFIVTSTGVQKVWRDGSKEIKIPTNDDFVDNNGIETVSLEKYGSSGDTITLNNLVRLYTDNDSKNPLTSGYKFIFNATYLYSPSLSDETLLDIFGENGMVYINRTSNSLSDKGILNSLNSGFTANELRTALSNLSTGDGIKNIYIRHDFATYHEIGFQIVASNDSRAIEIDLDLLIQTNVTMEMDAEIETYAGYKQQANGSLNYKNSNTTKSVSEKLSTFNGYYIVRGGDGYVLSNADNVGIMSVGQVVDGTFLFNDFFSTEVNNYSLTIYLDEIENDFALTYNVNFTVNRNIKIEYNGNIYSILSNADALSNYFTIGRIKDGEELSFTPRISLGRGDSSNLRLSGNGLDATVRINEANAPFFDYNVSMLSEELIFELAIEGSSNYDEVARLTLNYDLGERYSYESLAKQIYLTSENGNILPTIQTVNGVNYILVQQDNNWHYSSIITASAYTFEIRQFYLNSNGERISQEAYGLPGNNTISFINLNEAIRGLNDKSCYIIAEIYSGSNKKQATMLIPLLVSNIGLDYISYSNDSFNNLANAISNPNTLIENGVYEEVRAGADYEIAHQMLFTDTNTEFRGFIFPEGTGITTSLAFVPTQEGYYNNLVNNIYQDEETKTWHVNLNHLSNTITTAFVALRLQVSNGSFVQNFYYILKVSPDTTVNSALYAFDSGREEISGQINGVIGGENGINLSEKFSNQTLHVGEERFSVMVYDKQGNDTGKGSDLKFAYKVVSVTINNHTYTNEVGYLPYIDIEFREVNGHINMLVTPKTTAIMTLIIKRVYDGGERGETRQVIGGEIEYKFVINSTINYSLSYDGNNVSQSGNDASIVMNSADLNIEMDVKLLSTVNSTTSVVYGRLQVNGYSDEGNVVTNTAIDDTVSENNDDILLTVTYDPASAKLTLERGTYLEKDKIAYITFYTDYGYLGTLTVNLTASAEIDYTDEAIAGYTYNFKTTFVKKLVLNGKPISSENYTINSVRVEGEQEGKELFEFNNGTEEFKLYSSIKDVTLNISIDITIEGKHKYSFIMKLNIKANIKQTDGVSTVGTSEATAERKEHTQSITAKNDLKLDTENLMSFVSKNGDVVIAAPANFDVLYSWRAISGSDYIVEGENQKEPTITTKDVNKIGATVVLLITIHLQRDGATYQEFCVRYTFNITPNTEIQISYPDPTRMVQTTKYFEYILGDKTYYLNVEDGKEETSGGGEVGYYFVSGVNYYKDKALTEIAGSLTRGETKMGGYSVYSPITRGEEFDADYFKNGTSFASAKDDFFGGNATFGGKRLNIQNLENSSVGTNYKATLIEMQNITISTNSGDLSLEDGNNILVDDTIPNKIDVKNMKFTIGENGVDIGIESYAIFLIESNGVTETYKVVIKENVLSLVINQENSEGTNSLETFYIDNILSNNIFAEARMIEYTTNSTTQNTSISSIIGGNYRLIFSKTNTDGTISYKYRDIVMSNDDIGKTLYLDIGQSLIGYAYLGTYHNNVGSFTVNILGELVEISEKATRISDEALYASLPKLVSRVKLTYVDTRVTYDYVNAGLKFSTSGVIDTDDEIASEITSGQLGNYTTEQKAEQIRKVVSLSSFNFKFDNGANDKITHFSTIYNYTTDLDIAVEISGLEHVNKIYVNQEITSLITENNVYHPSTGQQLTSDEIKTRELVLNLQVVGIDKPVESVSNIDEYINRFEGIATPYYKNTDNGYLAISASLETATDATQTTRRVLDYRITGFGADNDGSYVLLYFTYTATRDEQTYVKDFCLVYKVIADYQVSYLNTTAIDEDDNGVISNQSTPYSLYATNSEYNFNIAGASNGLNIVSVKHTRSSTPNKEVGASGFTYSLTLDENIQGYSYNIGQNVESKLGKNLSETTSLWIKGSNEVGKTEWSWSNVNENALLAFNNVGKVIFGSQSYRLKAVDEYGYTFYVYFTLQSGSEVPTAKEEGTFSITEGYDFDIAAVFERLNVVADSKTQGQTQIPIDITSAEESNDHGTTFRVLNIANLEAWGFTEGLTVLAPELGDAPLDHYFNEILGGGYSLNANASWLEVTDANYLAVPNFVYTSVTKLEWYYNGERLTGLTGKSGPLATKSDLVFNTNSSSSPYRNIEARYTMPKLPAWVYGTSTNVQVTMVITLTYSKNGNTEVFDLPVRITVNRDYMSSEKVNNVVRDGEEFKISDYINASSITAGVQVPTEYFDDTLKITLPGNRQVVYTLENLSSGNKVTNRVESNEDYGYTRTIYVSLSQILDEALYAGNQLRLTVVESGNSALQNTDYSGYYIEYAGNAIYGAYKGVEGQKELSIEIANMNDTDQINIPMAEQLRNAASTTTITKYYLARTNKDDNYTYRISQRYTVTNYYNSISVNRSTNYRVEKYLMVEDAFGAGVHQYIIPRLGWTYNLTLNIAERSDGGLESVPFDSFNSNTDGYIYYKITDEASSGAAIIDEYTGQITTTSAFIVETHYINVAIYIKAAGLNGEFESQNINDRCLGTVRFMLRAPSEDSDGNVCVNDIPMLEIDNINQEAIIMDSIGYSNGKQGEHNKESITLPSEGRVFATMAKAQVGIDEELIDNLDGSFTGYNSATFNIVANAGTSSMRFEVAFDKNVNLYVFDEDSRIFALAQNEDGNYLTVGTAFASALYRIDKTSFDRPESDAASNRRAGTLAGDSMIGYRIVDANGNVYYLNVDDVTEVIAIVTKVTEIQFTNRIVGSSLYTLNELGGLNFYAISTDNSMYIPLGEYGVTFAARMVQA